MSILPDYDTLYGTGSVVLNETYQGYTVVVRKLYNEYEEMLAVCYDLNNVPLWRLFSTSNAELSDVVQLDAFVGGRIEDPQLIWYVNGTGFYSYNYGPAKKLRWFLPADDTLGINDSICHFEDYDGTFYVAFSDVLMHISEDGKLMWRTQCNNTDLFWPASIEVDEYGISVLYDNNFGLTNQYKEARFTLDGAFLYTTQREIPQDA